MSDIAVEVTAIKDALDGPRMRLVNSKWAPLVLAVFRSAFGPDAKQVKTERLHALVDGNLEDLKALGHDVPPNVQGRGLCLEWMNNQWLKRVPAEDGGEAYELTSDALAAQRVMEGMSRERSLLSESRLTTILDTVRRWALEANPDRSSRIASLDEEITRLTEERDRLVEGRELVRASDDRMLTGYLDVVDLMAQLPGDFRRVEEQIEAIHKQMLQSFRAENRPKGEVLDEYLLASDHLVEQTPEGKAFESALTILGDDALLNALRRDLHTIVDHPFAEALNTRERLAFTGLVAVLRTGLVDVQRRRMKASYSLQEQLSSHDTAQEREFTTVMRRLQQELDIWMQTARPRDWVPMPWMPAHHQVEYLRTRFYDPAEDRPVPVLEDVSQQAPEPLSMEHIRSYGGPLLDEVRQGISEALERGATTLGTAFNTLDIELRRPVELFGLLQMATEVGAVGLEDAGLDLVETVRPDGSRRLLLMPRLELTPDLISTTERTLDA